MSIKRELGVSFCGLACAICHENENCVGCRNDGCSGKDWCKDLKCCIEKGINGCWECADFPCTGGMHDKMRVRTFAKYIKDNGEDKFLDCIINNENAGVIYHYPGELLGDYDQFETEEEIVKLIEKGKGM
ncbi:MAG: DUF3795 domain-containing protein [Clostridia bacterium]|jgi:hypothetical protein